MAINRQFTLARRPHGRPQQDDFLLRNVETPKLQPGQFLIRNHYASLDPAIRGWLDDKESYMPPIPLGAPVRATTVGVVAQSATDAFAVGQWVVGLNAIENYSVGAEGGFTGPIDVSTAPSPTNFLSILGSVGLTAYFGLLDAGEPKAGETVLVTGAAGAVGSLVGQIAKIKGCRTIGIAGGAEKCARLLKDYGFDGAIDYRGKSAAQLDAEIKAAAPNGVDVIFENVGGDILDAGLLSINKFGRIVLCGLISEYNSEQGAVGSRNIWQLIVKSAQMRGFLIKEHIHRFPEGIAAMSAWIKEGKLRADEDIVEGIDNAYPAFMRLFDGANTGKLILKIAP